jgi:hypothetical protein
MLFQPQTSKQEGSLNRAIAAAKFWFALVGVVALWRHNTPSGICRKQ